MAGDGQELKGQEFIAALTARHPGVPRSIAIKTDVVREGVAWSPALTKLGRWAIPHVYHIYEWDEAEFHNQDEVQGKPWIQLPTRFAFADGTCSLLRLEANAPYTVHEIGEGLSFHGRYMLHRDGEALEEVYFEPRPAWYERRTSDGTPFTRIAAGNGEGCIVGFSLLQYCEYFSSNDQCLFCCIKPTWERAKKVGLERTVRRRVDQMVEVLEVAKEEQEIGHINLTGGGLLDRHKEADFYVEALQAINRVMGANKVPIQLVTQAMEEDDLKRIHEAGEGMIHISHPLEVWDERLWPTAVPGKARYVGRERWLESLCKGVKIFGYGRVASNVVGGLEMAPANGFTDWHEALENTFGGFRWLWDHGIVANATIWIKAPGSSAENFIPPPTDYYLEIERRNYDIKFEYRPPRDYSDSCCIKCMVVNCARDYDNLLGMDYAS